MHRLSTFEIRKLFLEYFEELNHQPVDSSRVALADDPTLLFVNAGMVQFKDVYLGREKRAYKRATTSQKCLRVSGKHNDLENVGPSPRHHTFFEMLGNFSFGDYFKADAIQFAWHLLIDKLGLSIERLWFTVYQEDDEAAALWQKVGAPPERILRFGKKDNWWAMGDIGPCGPCSEIHYYWGDLQEQTPAGVNADDEYLEIWNLVFMQYEQKEVDGELIPLPKPSVDTGAGLERLASILQGVDNNYDTDAFTPILDHIQALLGHTPSQRQTHLVGYRVIADHSRAIVFLINDGILPGNEGRAYVTRMILRRAARFGKRIGFEQPFLASVCRTVIAEYSTHYQDLLVNQDLILQTVTAEEKRFQRTLNSGLALLNRLIADLQAAQQTVIPGRDAFRLWDTYGFPLDITQDIAQEHGFTVDVADYQAALEQQRQQSSRTQRGENVSAYAALLDDLHSRGLLAEEGVKSVVYENMADVETSVIAILHQGRPLSAAKAGDSVEIVLPQTPFYVESGGQVSDTGEIYYFPEDMERPVWSVCIDNTRRPLPGLVVHSGKVSSGTVQVGDPAYAVIDSERRWDIMRNHTGTHLLHAELRAQLGTHVRQRGSLVAPDRLRFDFSHDQPLTAAQLAAIEEATNAAILANYPVMDRWTSFQRAVDEGALAFFEEKYEDTVRVITIGHGDETVSMELCGGTHVETTGEIGPFIVISEGSSAAGVRRIEALTGHAAQSHLAERLATLNAIANSLSVPPEQTSRAVQRLQASHRHLEGELEQMRTQVARLQSETLLGRALRLRNLALLAEQIEAGDVEQMRQMTDWLRDKLGSSVVVLGAVIEGKPLLVAAATADAIEQGIHAGHLVRDIAKIIGGSGGGRPNMAQAGGRDPDKLPEALAQVQHWLEQKQQG